MFLLKKLLSAIVLPPMGLLLLAFAGFLVGRRYPKIGRGLVCLSLTTLFLLSLPTVALYLSESLAIYPPISTADLGRAQAIVILGGGINVAAPEYGSDTISRGSLERVRYGRYLQVRSGLPILVTSGSPYGGLPEGDLMKQAIEQEFQGKVKWNENKSNDTAENAAYSAPILKKDGITRIVLVSHFWHLRRAVKYFENQGLEVFPAPMGFITSSPSTFANVLALLPSGGALEKSREAVSEWLGIFVQELMLRIHIGD